MGSEGVLTLSWLIRLRWAALGVYGALLALAWKGLDLDLPLALCGGLLLVLATSNLALQAWWDSEGPAPRGLAGGVLALDALLFAGLLYATGGPANPCSALFLVHVALAASVLGSRWGWAMALWVSALDALLFPWHQPLGHLDHAMEGMAWHLWGMWAGLSAACGLVAHFVGRLSDALALQRARAEALQAQADREARLAALTALAAGAAHELATPLATLAVVAEDLDPADPDRVAADVALIRAEVDRCRILLDGLALEGGQLVGETAQWVDLTAWSRRLPEILGTDVEAEVAPGRLRVPPRAFTMVIRSLVKNAREAAPGEPVTFRAFPQDGGIRLEVRDRGAGFPEGVRARVGEPFLTTKGEQGLGLGLFLAQGFAHRLGGRLEVGTQGGCTSVSLWLPEGEGA